MRKGTTAWLVAATVLILAGCILFAGVMTILDWDFFKLVTVEYEINTYTVSEAFDSIVIDTDTADVVFVPSEDGVCRVECREEKNAGHSVAVKDGTLTVALRDDRSAGSWIKGIGLNFGTPEIRVCLSETMYDSLRIDESTGDVAVPEDFTFNTADLSSSTGDIAFRAAVLGAVRIETSTGDIRVENTTVGSLDLAVSTGDVIVSGVACTGDLAVGVSTGEVHLRDVVCGRVVSDGNTGDISLGNVVAEESFFIERSTGDVTFDGCDAAAISVKTDTGDVTGSLLSNKMFVIDTNTGDVDVPETVDGGRCEIVTDNGDIELNIL